MRFTKRYSTRSLVVGLPEATGRGRRHAPPPPPPRVVVSLPLHDSCHRRHRRRRLPPLSKEGITKRLRISWYVVGTRVGYTGTLGYMYMDYAKNGKHTDAALMYVGILCSLPKWSRFQGDCKKPKITTHWVAEIRPVSLSEGRYHNV